MTVLLFAMQTRLVLLTATFVHRFLSRARKEAERIVRAAKLLRFHAIASRLYPLLRICSVTTHTPAARGRPHRRFFRLCIVKRGISCGQDTGDKQVMENRYTRTKKINLSRYIRPIEAGSAVMIGHGRIVAGLVPPTGNPVQPIQSIRPNDWLWRDQATSRRRRPSQEAARISVFLGEQRPS